MKKFFIVVIILAILIIGGYFGLEYHKQKEAEKERFDKRRQELKELKRQEEEQARRKAELKRRDQEARAKMQQGQQRRPAQPTPSRPKRSSVTHRHAVQRICAEHRCKLLKYHEKGYNTYIEVSGPDHSSVSDILDPLIREGVVNFKEHKDKFDVKIINGKRVYVAAYTLNW